MSRFTTFINNTGGKFAIITAGVIDTRVIEKRWQIFRRWQIVTGINDTSNKFVASVNNGNNIRLLTP
jgi:hypothetical protein